MDVNEIKFRCSSLGYIMTEGKSSGLTEKQQDELHQLSVKEKKTTKQEIRMLELIEKRDAPPELSETAITHCVDVYVSAKYNRFTEISAKQLDKGNETEEDSITIVSRMNKTYFAKNTEFISNEFIRGTPDLYKGESILKAEVIRDTKSSWDVYSFNRAKKKALNKNYYWQGMGYMDLTGASECYIDYCLNNTPFRLVNKELYHESFNHEGSDTPAWIELQIIANHTYDKKTFDEYINRRGIVLSDEYAKAVYESFVEIPIEERYFNFKFERDEAAIKSIHERVKRCREYLQKTFIDETRRG